MAPRRMLLVATLVASALELASAQVNRALTRPRRPRTHHARPWRGGAPALPHNLPISPPRPAQPTPLNHSARAAQCAAGQAETYADDALAYRFT